MAYDVVSLFPPEAPGGQQNSATQSRWPRYVNTGGKFSEYGNHQKDRQRDSSEPTKSEEQAKKLKTE